MNIIGVYGSLESRNHDSGATLFVDGNHIVSIDEDRLTRKKHEGAFPYKSIEYCLGDIKKDDIDIVAYSPSPVEIDEIVKKTINYLKSEFINAKLWLVSHHMCHAASTVFTSPFNSGSFLTLDGAGNGIWDFVDKKIHQRERNSIGYFDKDKGIFNFHRINLSTLRLYTGPNGELATSECGTNIFGWFYESICDWIYQKKMNIDHRVFGIEGKIMGLSSYGKFDIKDSFVPYVKSTEYSKDFFDCDSYQYGYPIVQFHYLNRIVDFFETSNYTPEQSAYYLQKHYEDAILYFISELRKDYLSEDVCFAGGCFLNINANTLLRPLFKNIHIPPYPNDSGVHFGAAVWSSYKSKERIEIPYNIALLGKSYEDYVPEEGEYYEDFHELCEIVAKHLEDNKIVAWFQGRSEHGPRALGSRSILMSPSKKENKDIMNSRVKHREYWRPFAGITLEGRGYDSPYMLYSEQVLTDDVPAITHEDNTCRMQTVNDELNPRICDLLRKLKNPVLLNTSFNDNGEPIVESPKDAIMSFRNMNIDYLVMGNYLIS